jgi:SulP family sulfate permease
MDKPGGPARTARIDLRSAHFWDITAVGARRKVVTRMRAHGTRVEVTGLNQASATMGDRFGALVHEEP